MELTQKGEMVSRLQAKASQIGKILTTLEKKYDTKLDDSEMVSTPGSASLDLGTTSTSSSIISVSKKSKAETTGPPFKKPHLKFEIPPFNPNKIRKSPIGEANTIQMIEQQEPIKEKPEINN